jgi:nucleotide-binding universal stress UspA family protein
MYRSIMVPLDGSAFGEQALPYALSIVRASGAALSLVHVHRDQTVYLVGPTPVVDATENVCQRASEGAYLTALSQRLAAQAGRPISVALLDEPVADALAAHAAETHADLIVLTSHGRGGMSRIWLGSTADALVRQTATPLLVIRPTEERTSEGEEPHIEHVLIPLDGSELAEDILEHALALGSLTGARYTLLEAIDPNTVVYISPPATVSISELEIERLREAAQKYLDGVAERLRARGYAVQIAVALAPPSTAILEHAHTNNVDAIAMSTHGRSGVRRLLLGSVADKVIRGAGTPLLIHHPRPRPNR